MMAKYVPVIQHICNSARAASSSLATRGHSSLWMKRFEERESNSMSVRKLTLSSTLLNQPEEKSGKDLNITDACVKQLKKVASADEFLRISVEGGGCSGFTYKFELDKEIQEDDKVFEKDGAKIVADEGSMEFLKGSVIDYEVEMIKSAFRVQDNPQTDTSCSCGVSFSIKL